MPASSGALPRSWSSTAGRSRRPRGDGGRGGRHGADRGLEAQVEPRRDGDRGHDDDQPVAATQQDRSRPASEPRRERPAADRDRDEWDGRTGHICERYRRPVDGRTRDERPGDDGCHHRTGARRPQQAEARTEAQSGHRLPCGRSTHTGRDAQGRERHACLRSGDRGRARPGDEPVPRPGPREREACGSKHARHEEAQWFGGEAGRGEDCGQDDRRRDERRREAHDYRGEADPTPRPCCTKHQRQQRQRTWREDGQRAGDEGGDEDGRHGAPGTVPPDPGACP